MELDLGGFGDAVGGMAQGAGKALGGLVGGLTTTANIIAGTHDDIQAKKERQRQMAVITDSAVMLDHLNNGRVKDFNRIAASALDNKIGNMVDPSHTLQITEWVNSGDPELVEKGKNELRDVLREAKVRKLTQNDELIDSIIGKPPGIDQQQVNSLRKDIFAVSKDLRIVNAAYNRIKKIGKKSTAASDIALVFNFMKINDPGSTVREGEFATAQNAAGVPERAVNLYNNLLRGTRLSPEQRSDFILTAEGLVDGQQVSTDNQILNILQQVDADSIPRERVLGKNRLFDLMERDRKRKEKPNPVISKYTIEDLKNMTDEELAALRG